MIISAGKYKNILYERVVDNAETILVGKVVKKRIDPTAQEIIDEIV